MADATTTPTSTDIPASATAAASVPGAPADQKHPSHLVYENHGGGHHTHRHHRFKHRHNHLNGEQPHTHAASDPMFKDHPEVANHPAVQPATKP